MHRGAKALGWVQPAVYRCLGHESMHFVLGVYGHPWSEEGRDGAMNLEYTDGRKKIIPIKYSPNTPGASYLATTKMSYHNA